MKPAYRSGATDSTRSSERSRSRSGAGSGEKSSSAAATADAPSSAPTAPSVVRAVSSSSRDARGQPASLPSLEDERPSRGPQPLEDAAQHAPQPPSAVRREEPHAVGVATGAELRERRVERLGLKDARLALVEDSEARVEPGLERMVSEQPGAEAVDGRDPGAIDLADEVGPLELREPLADARPKLARRALGVGDDEERVHREPALADTP